jgi:hypothetical protein
MYVAIISPQEVKQQLATAEAELASLNDLKQRLAASEDEVAHLREREEKSRIELRDTEEYASSLAAQLMQAQDVGNHLEGQVHGAQRLVWDLVRDLLLMWLPMSTYGSCFMQLHVELACHICEEVMWLPTKYVGQCRMT